MISIHRALAFAALVPLVLGAPAARQATPSIPELVAGNKDFNILGKLVEVAGLGGALGAPKNPLTVFAPTDAAFGATAKELGFPGAADNETAVLDFLSTGIGALGKTQNATLKTAVGGILSYHVSPEQLNSTQVLSRTSIPTLLPNTTITREQGSSLNLIDKATSLQDPKIVQTDIKTAGGIVHVIDRVLFPQNVNADSLKKILEAQAGNTTSTAPTTTAADGATTGANDTTTVAAATPVPDEGNPCFPADAIVHMADGSEKPMRALLAGDVVRHSADAASPDAHSQIYLFSHKIQSGLHDFVRIESDAGHVITMSPTHYVYANGRMAAAHTVRVGDALTTLDGPAKVSAVRGVKAEGLFAPHTMHGDIVVGRVLASSYTQVVHPTVAHYALAPVRALVRMGMREPLGELLYNGADNAAAWAPKGPHKF